MANEYFNDTAIKFEHSPVNHKIAFQRETIGAHAYDTLGLKDYTDTDANTIYVNTASGNDSTGTGAKATPYKTYLKGANSCTVTKTKVLILNSGFVAEDFSTLSNAYFEGFFSDTGITATYSGRTLGFTPADANSIFVAKTGDDGDAGTAAAPKLTIAGAIAACDATHHSVVIADSETYEEPGFEFTGNFTGLYAADQCAPTFKPNLPIAFDYSVSENVATISTIASGGSSAQYAEKDGLGNFYIFYTSATSPSPSYITKYNESGININTSTAISGIAARGICFDASGNIIIAYRKLSDNKFYYKILDTSYATVTAETKICDNACTTASAESFLKLADGGYFAFSPANAGYKFKIYNSDFSDRKALTGIQSVYPESGIIQLTGGNIVFASSCVATGYWYYIFDVNGNEVALETINIANNTIEVSCVATSDNCFFIMYTYGSGTAKKYNASGVLQDTLTITPAHGDIGGYGAGIGNALKRLEDGNILIIFGDANAYLGGPTYVQVFSWVDGSSVKDYGAVSANSNRANVADFSPSGIILLLDNGNILFAVHDFNDNSLDAKIYFPYYSSLMLCSVSSTINGIKLDMSLPNGKSVSATAKPIIKFCDFFNSSNESINYKSKVINSTAEVDFQNCKVYDSDSGIYCQNAKATVKKNIFYRLTDGYSVHVKGAAASSGDITVENNTFFDVYAGIRLEDNGGTNEIVRDDIFQDCNVYDILAEAAMTFTNSIYTGNLSNATASGCIKANALFVNEGLYDPDDIDLRLKKIILGHFADSPAKGLATGGSDAGAYDQIEVGGPDTWTSATIEKPVNGVDIWLEPSETVKTVSQDGTINAKNKGFTEYLELQYLGILSADFLKLLAIMQSTSNLVRIYLDPTTNPGDFNVYRYIPGKVMASAKNFRLGATGVQDVKILFARKYE